MTEAVCTVPGCAKCGRDKSPAVSRTVCQVNEELTINKKDGNDLLIRIKHDPADTAERVKELEACLQRRRDDCERYRIQACDLSEELAIAQETVKSMHSTYNALAASIKKLAEIA